MVQQELLENSVLVDYQPILRKAPNKALGEMFPTVWYASTIEVTSNQQAIISRSVLTAENPNLRYGVTVLAGTDFRFPSLVDMSPGTRAPLVPSGAPWKVRSSARSWNSAASRYATLRHHLCSSMRRLVYSCTATFSRIATSARHCGR